MGKKIKTLSTIRLKTAKHVNTNLTRIVFTKDMICIVPLKFNRPPLSCPGTVETKEELVTAIILPDF